MMTNNNNNNNDIATVAYVKPPLCAASRTKSTRTLEAGGVYPDLFEPAPVPSPPPNAPRILRSFGDYMLSPEEFESKVERIKHSYVPTEYADTNPWKHPLFPRWEEVPTVGTIRYKEYMFYTILELVADYSRLKEMTTHVVDCEESGAYKRVEGILDEWNNFELMPLPTYNENADPLPVKRIDSYEADMFNRFSPENRRVFLKDIFPSDNDPSPCWSPPQESSHAAAEVLKDKND